MSNLYTFCIQKFIIAIFCCFELAEYKEEYAKLAKAYPSDIFADLATIKDAIDFNICIRDIDGNLDLKLAEDCAISYQNNLKLAKSFDLDEVFMIERVKEILE